MRIFRNSKVIVYQTFIKRKSYDEGVSVIHV